MYNRNVQGMFREPAYAEPVIQLRSPENLRDRNQLKKRYHLLKSRRLSNPQSSVNIVSDRRNHDLKSEQVNQLKDNERNKFHLRSSRSRENPTVNRRSVQNNNPLFHNPETYKYQPFDMSMWTPNLGHPYSHVPQFQPNQTLLIGPEEYDQYTSDDSQENHLFPNTVKSMPCSPGVNQRIEDHCVIDPGFTVSEQFGEKHFGYIYPYEFYENQLNKQLTKLSMLHAQQLNIQVLLEREWLKLHKLNCLKMSKYGYNDLRKSENDNQFQFPFPENQNITRTVRSTSDNNHNNNHNNHNHNKIPVHSPKMNQAHSSKHQSQSLNLNKNYKSADGGLDNSDEIDDNNNQPIRNDDDDDDVYGNSNYTGMQQRCRNSVAEEIFDFNPYYHMISPNNTLKIKKQAYNNLNSTIHHGRNHPYSQESSNRFIHSTQTDNYATYPSVYNELLSQKLTNKSNNTTTTNNNNSNSNYYYMSELNNHQIIKKPNVPINTVTSKKNQLTIPLNNEPNQNLEKSPRIARKPNAISISNNHNSTRIISENPIIESSSKINRISSPDHQLYTRKYLKSDYNNNNNKKKFLSNEDDSKLTQNTFEKPSQMYALRRSLSQPCIYEPDLDNEEMDRSSSFQNDSLIKQQINELNIHKSSNESIDCEILDIDSNASSSASATAATAALLWFNNEYTTNDYYNTKRNTYNNDNSDHNHNHNDNDQYCCLQDTNQLLPTYSRIINQVDKLPKHIEVDSEKDYEYTNSNATTNQSSSSILIQTNHHHHKKIQHNNSMFNDQYNNNNDENNNNLKVIHTTNNINDMKKSIYEQDEKIYSTVHISKHYQQTNHLDTNDSSILSNSLSKLKLSNSTTVQHDKIIKTNNTSITMIKSNNYSNNSNSNNSHNSNPDFTKSLKHTTDDQLNNYEFDLTNDSGISSVNKDLTITSGVICLHKEINHMVFGPCRQSFTHITSNSTIHERNSTPTWLAICTDEMTVFVYDLWTHNCIIEFMNHVISSTSPVMYLFSMNSSEYYQNDIKTHTHIGFLCVIQKNGILTLYNITTRNMISRIILNCEICCASLIPCQGQLNQYLPQSIFSIDVNGSLTISQWKIIKNSNDTILKEPTVCDETLEIGTNIFKKIIRKGKLDNFKYCTYIHDNLRSISNTDMKLPKIAITNNNNNNNNSTSIHSFNDLINANEFSFITASYECKQRNILRLTNWICKYKTLHNTVSYNKILTNDSNATLIDMTIVESGCSGSLCMCFTNEIFWLSLQTFDILSKFKLPTFMQPIHCLSKSWPQPADLNQSQHRRTWIYVSKNRLLEISPFESQRRLDINGRRCLLVFSIPSTNSQITNVSSNLNTTPIIAAALENGEVHLTLVPESCYSCMVECCSLGFTDRNELVNHVVQDHYLDESTDGFRCSWGSCDLYLPLNCSQFNKEVLEHHAHKHVYSSS
ncbi:unnamed protein product [Schistosoma turkestanicum]|nr:unnamed protein product [Schistosoma turkestanicum]